MRGACRAASEDSTLSTASLRAVGNKAAYCRRHLFFLTIRAGNHLDLEQPAFQRAIE